MRVGFSGASSSARQPWACLCARPRPAVPLWEVSVEHSVQNSACAVLCRSMQIVLLSVCDGVCGRSSGIDGCGYVAQTPPDAAGPAGRGSPCGESQRPRRGRARGTHLPWFSCSQKSGYTF